MIVCGTFEGKFKCKNSLGGVPRGKNAIPGVDTAPASSESTTGEQDTPNPVPEAGNSGQNTQEGMPAAADTACQHGMVGTPPNCRCPKNSELLGGNCVHYTAICSNGLAADYNPKPCQGVDEKLACKMRQDGLKDCCCLTYDKL
jgi:hypothetical protein